MVFIKMDQSWSIAIWKTEKKRLKINVIFSTSTELFSAVSQRSVLGPLFFNIHLKNLLFSNETSINAILLTMQQLLFVMKHLKQFQKQ